MAGIRFPTVYYLDTDYRDLTVDRIETPLFIASDVITNNICFSESVKISFPLWELSMSLFCESNSQNNIEDLLDQHKDFEQLLKAWIKEAKEANWKGIRDIKQEYSSASLLSGNRVVFNIKGNRYRLIVRINYDYGIVWIRFIGTHSEYDKIDATKI